MIPYSDLSSAYYAIFGIAVIILMILAVKSLVFVLSENMEGRYLFFSALMLVFILAMLQGITDMSSVIKNGKEPSFLGGVTGSLPVAGIVCLLLWLGISEGLFFAYVCQNKKKRLMSGSIKESLDALPDGVCFYSPDGQPLLVNAQMQRLSSEMFHTELLNGKSFWDNLQRGNVENDVEILQKSNSILVCDAHEKIWDIRRDELEVNRRCILSLVACDVTEQYRIKEELKQRNQIMKEVNERLRRYSQSMDETIRKKEILDAKIKVHDDVGRAILAFHAYLEQPAEERNREKLLLLWKYTISVMKNETAAPVSTDIWQKFLEAAKAVDVDVVINGELPDNEKEKMILMTALHECLTNTVKHANGNRLCLSITGNEDTMLAELTNNGKKPDGPVLETGGLKNLRQLVEEAGGTMSIHVDPDYVLKIILSKEEKENE